MKSERPRILALAPISWGIIAAALIATVEGYRALEWKYAHRSAHSQEEEHPAAFRYRERVESELSKPDPNRPDWAGHYSSMSNSLVLAPTSGYISWYATDIGEYGFQFGRVVEKGDRLHLYNRSNSEYLVVRRLGEVTLFDASDPKHCFIRDNEQENWDQEQARRHKLCQSPPL